jgi:hypothetical protein
MSYNVRDRRSRQTGVDSSSQPEIQPHDEIEAQVRQIARAFEGLARSFVRLGELLTAQGDRGRPNGTTTAEPRRREEPSPQRIQPTAELPSAPQSVTLALEQALLTRIDEHAKDLLTDAVDLFEEADRHIPELRDYSMRARSAYLAIWAGMGRSLQAQLEPWWERLPEGVEKSFRVFFGKLTTVTKRLRCEWVDALHRAWTTDWDVYVRFYRRRLVEELPGVQIKGSHELSLEEDQMLARDRLSGLLQRNRPRASDARQLIAEAAEVLDGDDEVMSRVLTQYQSLLVGHEDFVELLQEAGIDATAVANNTGVDDLVDDDDEDESYDSDEGRTW